MTAMASQDLAAAGGGDGSVSSNIIRIVDGLMRVRGVKAPEAWLALGMSKGSWYSRMRGETDFTAPQMAGLSALLNTPIEDLYADPDELFRTRSR